MNFTIEDYTWPAFMGRKPFYHQKHTVRFILANKRAFILNDMGTGKTLSTIWACDILITAKKIRRVLIIGPLSTMRSVWFNELMLNTPHLVAGIAHHPIRQNRINIIKNPTVQFVIINHDGIKIVEDEIINQQFDVIIIDEITAFKSNSERTKCMKRIADAQFKGKNPKRQRDGGVWGMSGALTPNAPTEAYYPAKIVNPLNQYLPQYYGQFRDACMTQINEMMWVPKPIAAQIVTMCCQPAIRFTREECLDLPDTTYQTLEVPLSAEQATYYDKMRKEAMIESDSGTVTAVNSAVLLNKLLQISAGAVKNDVGQVIEIGCKERLDQLFEIYEETPQKKLVIFATYRATIEMLMRELQKKGIEAACIHGDVAQNLRASYIERFQSGTLQVLVLQPQSTAHGITLTAASTIVWFSLIASNELFQQGNARIVRAGQTRKTLIIMMVGTKAEKHVARILENKDNLSQEVQKIFANHDL